MAALVLLILVARLAATFAAIASIDSFGSCLPTAIPAGRRKTMLDFNDQEGLPLGIVVQNWSSARIGSYLVKFLAEEVLGYKTNFSCTASSAVPAFFCLASCTRPTNTNDPGCDKHRVRTGGNHLAWEVWDGSYATTFNSWQQTLAPFAPHKVGHLGYVGVEGIFTTQKESMTAYNQHGLLLEYYKTWNLSWFDVSQLFTNLTDIPDDLLMPCKDSGLYWTKQITQYFETTGDADGVERDSNGDLVAKCFGNGADGPMGRYWMSPACRANPAKCVLFYTGGEGWYISTALHQLAGNDMPVAIGVAATTDSYNQLARDYKTLVYWWTQDSTFIDLRPKLIRFPPNDPAAWVRGDRSSERKPLDLSKFMNPILRSESSVFAMFRDMEMTQKLLDTIVHSAYHGAQHNPPISETAVVCDWLRNNEAVWRKWIPDPSLCSLGYGMVNASGAFVADKSVATACGACTPGTFSDPAEDSETHVCVQCSSGSFSNARADECYSQAIIVEGVPLSVLAAVMMVLGVIVGAACLFCVYRRYKGKQAAMLHRTITELRDSVHNLQDEVVAGMRRVTVNYDPHPVTQAGNVAGIVSSSSAEAAGNSSNPPAVAPTGILKQSSAIGRGQSAGSNTSTKTRQDISVPDDLKEAILLVLSVGALVQLSVQRPDGWAFGRVVVHDAHGERISHTEFISYDAGWFPLSCVEISQREDLERFAKTMGYASKCVSRIPVRSAAINK